MYLKSIEIHGFKSFLNKTVFQFHDGITGIVGPNGSGKSNVADAVRWVLGEQRVKQLRGGSMQDVIFAGTENRKPLGYAYVAITLSNEDHSLPVSYDEVTVARRLYRSGESEYMLNGTACRLKDINELFYDTGIGKEGYSIIGQGQIDKILSGKPEERRELFDEAAGIVKFKRRKLEAQRKLENEHANLIRVNDILAELHRQIGPLERQSEKAKIYLQLREQLKTYDVNLFLTEYLEGRKQEAQLQEKYDAAAAQLEEVTRQVQSARESYDRISAEVEELRTQQEQLQADISSGRLSIQQYSGQIEVAKEQIRAGRQNLQQQEERIKAIRTEQEDRNRSIVEHEKKLAQVQETIEGMNVQAAQLEERYAACLEEIRVLQEQSDQNREAQITLLNERSTLKASSERLDTILEQIRIRRSSVGGELLKLKSTQEQNAEHLKKLEEDILALKQKIEELSRESEATNTQLMTVQDRLSADNQKMEQEQQECHRENSGLETLKNNAERYDGYGSSIRKVMELRSREKGLLGVVADLIRTEKKYEIAIETALGGGIQNIVTEDEDTAKRMIAYLKENRFGRATFLPLTAMKYAQGLKQTEVLKEPGVIGIAETLVEAEQRYAHLIRYLLGRTIVVDQIDHAVKIAAKYHYSLRIVTLEGESLTPGGSITGGAFKNNSNLLGRRREIEELEESLKKRRELLENLRSEIDSLRSTRQEYRDHIRQLGEQLQALYLQQNTLQVQKKELQGKQEASLEESERYQDETEQIADQIRSLEADRKKAAAEMSDSAAREEQLQRSDSACQADLAKLQGEEAQVRAELEELRLSRTALEQQEKFLSQEIVRCRDELHALELEEQQIRTSGKDSLQYEQERSQRILQLEEQIRQEEEKIASLESALKDALKQSDEKSRSLKDFFDKREEYSQMSALLDRECFRLNAQMERAKETAQARSDYMWEEYGLTYSSALPLKREDLGSPGKWRRNMSDLKRQIKELGSVNVNAIEEYKEVSERYTFLSGQREDLQKAEDALQKIIRELDEGMRRQFREEFEKIRVEFDHTFTELFGGGKGTLELVEEEDILEAGIRIIAQPPGKKLQNMMQLSGGEKSLTAIALLFAIQNLKPSPFCLLDEIEAALDENNVDRYAEYLHKLTKNTQFIIITHRRGTMAAADRLYGVTMQEKGVSALVSVNLVEGQLDN